MGDDVRLLRPIERSARSERGRNLFSQLNRPPRDTRGLIKFHCQDSMIPHQRSHETAFCRRRKRIGSTYLGLNQLRLIDCYLLVRAQRMAALKTEFVVLQQAA